MNYASEKPVIVVCVLALIGLASVLGGCLADTTKQAKAEAEAEAATSNQVQMLSTAAAALLTMPTSPPPVVRVTVITSSDGGHFVAMEGSDGLRIHAAEVVFVQSGMGSNDLNSVVHLNDQVDYIQRAMTGIATNGEVQSVLH